jgi:hypothetical protein
MEIKRRDKNSTASNSTGSPGRRGFDRQKCLLSRSSSVPKIWMVEMFLPSGLDATTYPTTAVDITVLTFSPA